MPGAAYSITTQIYVQVHEQTAISAAVDPPKNWKQLSVWSWKSFSITSAIFITS